MIKDDRVKVAGLKAWTASSSRVMGCHLTFRCLQQKLTTFMGAEACTADVVHNAERLKAVRCSVPMHCKS